MDETRWRGRPVLGALVRLVAYLVPVVCSVAAAAALSRALPPAEGAVAAVGWWVVVLGASTAVAVGVERLARRLLPLGALLSLSLAFPDQAPSRFRLAVRSGGVRRLEERVASARAACDDATPAEAATAILELAALLNVHDRRTRGHSERVRVFADLLGEELGLPEHDRDRLRWAALLHDIGKLTVPAEILNKNGKPDADEWAVLQGHPAEAATFLEPLAAWMGEWTRAATEHHERWDGTGYPLGLAGTDIALGARIVAVADSYEVMTAVRAYKRPMSTVQARAELARCAGGQFDPAVVRAFLNISLGRLRLGAGPLAWLAQVPFLGELPRLAGGTASLPNAALVAKTGVAGTALAAGAGTAVVAAPEPIPAPPPPAAAVAEAPLDGGAAPGDPVEVAGLADRPSWAHSPFEPTADPSTTTTTTAPEAPPAPEVPPAEDGLRDDPAGAPEDRRGGQRPPASSRPPTAPGPPAHAAPGGGLPPHAGPGGPAGPGGGPPPHAGPGGPGGDPPPRAGPDGGQESGPPPHAEPGGPGGRGGPGGSGGQSPQAGQGGPGGGGGQGSAPPPQAGPAGGGGGNGGGGGGGGGSGSGPPPQANPGSGKGPGG